MLFEALEALLAAAEAGRQFTGQMQCLIAKLSSFWPDSLLS
jgi:hypothetical protein